MLLGLVWESFFQENFIFLRTSLGSLFLKVKGNELISLGKMKIPWENGVFKLVLKEISLFFLRK
jgi:hypothetical protein